MGRKAIKAFVSSFARMGMVLGLCFLPITGAEARLSTVCGVVRLMLLGKNTKNIENAKELTKEYGPSVEEIAII